MRISEKQLKNIITETIKNTLNEEKDVEPIKKGDTIVFKYNGFDNNARLLFYWFVGMVDGKYVFFDWKKDPDNANSSDFWRMSEEYFDKNLSNGNIEIYDSLPIEKYGDELNDYMEEMVNEERKKKPLREDKIRPVGVNKEYDFDYKFMFEDVFPEFYYDEANEDVEIDEYIPVIAYYTYSPEEKETGSFEKFDIDGAVLDIDVNSELYKRLSNYYGENILKNKVNDFAEKDEGLYEAIEEYWDNYEPFSEDDR